MGALTDLILATEGELASVPADDIPINVLPGLDVKGVGTLELECLHEVLFGDAGSFPETGPESEDGPWLNRVPDSLVRRLAELDEPAVRAVAARWAATDQLSHHRVAVEDVTSRLLEMCAFAKKAIEVGKPVFLWTSL